MSEKELQRKLTTSEICFEEKAWTIEVPRYHDGVIFEDRDFGFLRSVYFRMDNEENENNEEDNEVNKSFYLRITIDGKIEYGFFHPRSSYGKNWHVEKKKYHVYLRTHDLFYNESILIELSHMLYTSVTVFIKQLNLKNPIYIRENRESQFERKKREENDRMRLIEL